MRVVVAAESGRLRDGLLAMLGSFLASEMVVVADDGPVVLEAIRSGQPKLVILDAGFAKEGAAEFVSRIKEQGNGVRFLVVTDRLGQFQPLLKVGVDRVLLKGFSAAELSTAVKELLEVPQD